MELTTLDDEKQEQYNALVNHVIQSWEWGQFRQNLGSKIGRFGIFENGKIVNAFTVTFHNIPFTPFTVGYIPKGPFPDGNFTQALKQISKEYRCAFIKIEPNVKIATQNQPVNKNFKKSPKPLFTKYNFVLDLTPSEEELLAKMHQKTRYNIRLAEKKGVKVEERVDDEAFNIYLELYFATTKRQNYHGHSREYHRKIWETLKARDMARVLIGFYDNKPLTAWMLFNFKDTLYYPYGGSSPEHRETMHSNLVAWEAVKLGKRLGLKYFDMWGALGPEADPKDPWYGFHRFKQGYGGDLVEYIGSFDFILNYPVYALFTLIDKIMPVKVILLKILGK